MDTRGQPEQMNKCIEVNATTRRGRGTQMKKEEDGKEEDQRGTKKEKGTREK